MTAGCGGTAPVCGTYCAPVEGVAVKRELHGYEADLKSGAITKVSAHS